MKISSERIRQVANKTTAKPDYLNHFLGLKLKVSTKAMAAVISKCTAKALCGQNYSRYGLKLK